MPDGFNTTDNAVSNKSQAQNTRASSHNIPANSSRRTSSSVPSYSHRYPLSPSGREPSNTPLTPEESPPFSRTTRKRTAGIVEAEDKDLDLPDASPAHTRSDSGDIHVCICQPEPKIPRPRNAFILYRQNQQAQVVAQNPGLANPEISKIIGEQWQNQPAEIKNRWKALAEEEKLRHQQQYPSYRYQPKRSNRRGSLTSEPNSGVEKPRCQKCGGKSILAPSTPYTASNSPATAHTPGSAATPVTRTLPVLRDLSLQSPAARRLGRFPGNTMSPHHRDDRDDLGPLSPDPKRRRYNNSNDHPATIVSRPPPPRYVAAPPPGPHAGPGTPFPFSQPPPQHPYPPAVAHARRESLPGIRGVVSPPGPMGPPPRPGPGYAQHRLSQGHAGPHDRSLTLPPLQTSSTNVAPGPMTSTGTAKSAKESIMTLDFWYKINVLSKVAPPAPVWKSTPRGPLVAIEGDSAEAVKVLDNWLSDTLGKGDDLNVKQIDGPVVSSEGSKQQIMAQYHRLAADWLLKSSEITEALTIKTESPTDSVMLDASSSTLKATKGRGAIDEDYDDSGEPTSNSNRASPNRVVARADEPDVAAKMDVDVATRKSSTSSKGSSSSSSAKPVGLIANYSLHASNFFACHIPIETYAQYSPKDHWEWTATQWRSIISPDLTIYVKDSGSTESGKPAVEIMEPGNVFVVKRSKLEGKDALEIEPSTLRRLGFEVSEWVRGFGDKAT
ncbi:Putative High mobility group box domain-containing protein [Septoria linicola]|uniref:High mobility group box domain-containing protein n=1 Tax=Septoria linicola TaxID=215465 RepID=A0A9Q9ALB2_9PEZI|nr:Putative High mobility group box domain-containing protein [Septoria linicola]